MEHFLTLQGEGYWTGHSAYFIRLGGCDVGCSWCDVKDSWDMTAHPQVPLNQIAEWLKNSTANIVVVTGGEPTMHDLQALTDLIHAHGRRAHIETSGTHPLSGDWDWITFSPKRFKKPLAEYYTLAHELKVIVAHKNDLRWGEEHRTQMHAEARHYLQPEWDQRAEMQNLCVQHILQEPSWLLSLQTHKYLGIE